MDLIMGRIVRHERKHTFRANQRNSRHATSPRELPFKKTMLRTAKRYGPTIGFGMTTARPLVSRAETQILLGERTAEEVLFDS